MPTKVSKGERQVYDCAATRGVLYALTVWYRRNKHVTRAIDPANLAIEHLETDGDDAHWETLKALANNVCLGQWARKALEDSIQVDSESVYHR